MMGRRTPGNEDCVQRRCQTIMGKDPVLDRRASALAMHGLGEELGKVIDSRSGFDPLG